jgi:hypothetical protein
LEEAGTNATIFKKNEELLKQSIIEMKKIIGNLPILAD